MPDHQSDCRHLGGMREATDLGPVWHCDVHGSCLLDRSAAGYQSCEGCSDYEGPRMRGSCRHQGDILRTGLGDLCGLRGHEIPIYACDLYGECAPRRFCRLQTVRNCLHCTEFQEEHESHA